MFPVGVTDFSTYFISTSFIDSSIALIAISLSWNTPINLKFLQDKKILNRSYIKLKILGDGDLKNKVNITTNYVSKQAQAKIEKAGGTLNILKSFVPKQNIKSIAKKLTESPNTPKK